MARPKTSPRSRLIQYAQQSDGEYSPSPQSVSSPTSRPSAITDTQDPYEQFQQNRQFNYGRGEQIQEELNGRAGGQQFWENHYRDQAANAYNPILSGEGAGYTQQERAAILREKELAGLPITQEDIDGLQMTDDERTGAMGNPYESRQFYRPEYQNSVNQSGIDRQREAYGDQAGRMRGAVDPSRLRLSESYGSDQNSIMDGSDGGVRGAITDDLKMRDGVMAGVGNIRQDAGFADRVRMTDRDVQDYQDRAATNVQNQKRSALDEIEQRAVASGNSSPLAMGALRQRYEQNAQVNGSDAALNARIAAKGQQADREFGIETNRQDSERGYTDAMLSGERMRQDGARTYAGVKSDAEMRMGDRRLGALQDREGMRLDAEQGLTDRSVDVERTVGNNRLQTEAGINDTNLGLARYQQDSGAAIWQGGDDRSSDRSRGITENRQGVSQYGQQAKFDTGFAVNNAASGRNAGVADGRRADQQEARGWLADNQKQASDNVNTANTGRLNLYGQQTDAMGRNTGDNAQYDLGRRANRFSTNFKTAFGGALGAGAGKGFTSGFGGG